MARLIYSAIMSLDGYTADADGRFEWAAPDFDPAQVRKLKETAQEGGADPC